MLPEVMECRVFPKQHEWPSSSVFVALA